MRPRPSITDRENWFQLANAERSYQDAYLGAMSEVPPHELLMLVCWVRGELDVSLCCSSFHVHRLMLAILLGCCTMVAWASGIVHSIILGFVLGTVCG